MGQRDFLLKEEKIDKLPMRAQKHFYAQHCGTYGSQQTGRSMCLVRFFVPFWFYCGCLIRNALTCSYSDSGPNKSTRFTRADIRTV